MFHFILNLNKIYFCIIIDNRKYFYNVYEFIQGKWFLKKLKVFHLSKMRVIVVSQNPLNVIPHLEIVIEKHTSCVYDNLY